MYNKNKTAINVNAYNVSVSYFPLVVIQGKNK